MRKKKVFLKSKRLCVAKSKTCYKVLFLGASESGKSTLIRQIRMLHDVDFTDEELRFFKERIQHSTIGYLIRLALAVKSTMVISVEWDRLLTTIIERIVASRHVMFPN